MNIAINTLPLSTEHRMRGTGVYTKNLIDALTKYEKNHSYSFFTRLDDIPKKTDVVHFPFFDPFFLTLPFFKHYPTVVTVHDLIPLVFPDKFPAGVRGRVKWQMQKISLMGAKGIITDSLCSKTDIVRLIGIPEDRVHVVPLAPSPLYTKARSGDVTDGMRARYHLPEQYVLYVGDVNWNKNVSGLLRAWKQVRAKQPKQSDMKLVLVGSAFTDAELPETRNILREIETLGITKSVVRSGFVKNEDMASLYAGAKCTVLPSWYEGFGFPVLESMACGTPVVATNRGSVPEIAGPALIADPGDTAALARAIREVVTLSPASRKALVKAGLEWAKKFTWKTVARDTAAAYERVLGATTL